MKCYFTHDTILARLRGCVKVEGSQKAVAKKLGVSQQYLTDVLKGRRDISDTVARKMGYEKVAVFFRTEGP